MPRIPLIAGNWKMFKTIPETLDFCQRLKGEVIALQGKQIDIAVAPPFTALAAAAHALKGTSISIAAQNAFWAESGAYTGEIAPRMLKDAGCRMAIVGHSERRQYFHETDDSVNKKSAALLKEGLIPIVCIGETLAERKEHATFQVVERQVREGLKGLPVKDPLLLVIAYEPVWAIGTGQTATPQQAQEVQAFLRKILGEVFSSSIAQGMRILYGGSVKPENTAELMAMEDVDGALVGGASLEINSFCQILKRA
ncbi:MAG: TpiA [Deltaproteobacteria bacterium]|jgi:triosephosphate isomerase|nr:TpiA [Deltaproteobacteria bacterium]